MQRFPAYVAPDALARGVTPANSTRKLSRMPLDQRPKPATAPQLKEIDKERRERMAEAITDAAPAAAPMTPAESPDERRDRIFNAMMERREGIVSTPAPDDRRRELASSLGVEVPEGTNYGMPSQTNEGISRFDPQTDVPQSVRSAVERSDRPAPAGTVPLTKQPEETARVNPEGFQALRMGNQRATRNQPVTPTLQSNLQSAIQSVYGPGHYGVVYSGGQPARGSGGPRRGSVRHDGGRAADVWVYGPDGKRLTGDRLAPLAQYWAANKFGGVGLEMRGGGIHLDEWSTPPAGGGMAWSYGANSPAQAQLLADIRAGRPISAPETMMAAAQGGQPAAAMANAQQAAAPPVTDEAWITGGAGAAPAPPVPAQAAPGAPPPTAMALQATGEPTRAERLVEALAQGGQSAVAGMTGGGGAEVSPVQRVGFAAEESSVQPIVQGGGNVRPVAFAPPSGTAEGDERKRALAEAMLADGMQGRRIDHPLQGVAQMAQAGIGGLGVAMADRRDNQRQMALAQALQSASGGGDLSHLYQVNPEAAFRLEMQRRAEQQAAQQAEIARQRELQDYERERADRMADYERQQQIQQQYRAPERPPADVQEYEYAVEQMRQRGTPDDQIPTFDQYQLQQRRAGATNVNVDTQGGNAALQKKLQETLGTSIGGNIEAGQQAQQSLVTIDRLDGLLGQTPGGLQNGLISLASQVGVEISDDQPAVEAALAVVERLVPLQRPPGSGPMSDRDVQMFRNSLPRLMNTPEGNALIIEGMRALAEYQIANGTLAQELAIGKLTLEQFFEGQRSLPNPFEGYGEQVTSILGDGAR